MTTAEVGNAAHWISCIGTLASRNQGVGITGARDSRSAGTNMIITLKSGGTAEYSFRKSDAVTLTVESPAGREQTLRKADVARIVEHKPKGSKGALLGAALGAGAGVGVGVGISQNFDETFLGRVDLMGLTFGAIGAVAGALIGHTQDKAHDEVLFQAP